jgi:hypothetical protein
MKRALNYGDLGTFLNDLRNANYHDAVISAMLKAWKRFDNEVPEFADTAISDEATEKLIKRFGEVVGNDVKPVTRTSYANNLRTAVSQLHDYYEATGTLNVTMSNSAPTPAPAKKQEHSGPLTYGDMGKYFTDYRDDYPDEENAGRWLSTYNSVIARVPYAAASEIDPERTEAILATFERVATSADETRAAAKQAADDAEAARLLALPELALSTVRNYQFWFRHAMRHYVEFAEIPYAEVDVEERRERRLAAARAEKEAAKAAEAKRAAARAKRKAAVEASAAAVVVEKAPVIVAPKAKAPKAKVSAVKAPQPLPERVEEVAAAVQEKAAPQALPAVAEEPNPVKEPGLTEYRFLLRRGTHVSLGLPDDLTAREAERLSRWIDTFVIDSEAG